MAEPSTRRAAVMPVLLAAIATWGCPVEDSPAPPSVVISPLEGEAGTKFPIQVRGTNTRFSKDTFVASLSGRGARVRSDEGHEPRIGGATAARLEVEIDRDAPAGPRVLTIEAPPDTFRATLEVHVPGAEPEARFDPTNGVPNMEGSFVIHGTATHFEQGVTTMMFPDGSGVQVLSLNVVEPTLAQAKLRIGEQATAAEHQVAIATRGELVFAPFTVQTDAHPSLSVQPPEGFEGRDVSVTVTGAHADFGVAGVDRAVLSFESGAGIRVSNVEVKSRTRLTARFVIASNARPGYQRFTVDVDPADPEQDVRSYEGSFSVRAPGSPSVRILPPAVHQGETATLWLEGRGTNFSDPPIVRPDAGSGVEVTSVSVLGPEGAALRLQVDDEALLGTRTIEVDDGSNELSTAIEVLPPDPATLAPSTQFLQAGATDFEVTLTSAAGGLEAGVTRAFAADHSGVAIRSLRIEDASTASVRLDLQSTAPIGRTYIGLDTRGSVSRAPLTVIAPAGAGSISVTPSIVRAGIGSAELVVTARNAPLPATSIARISDPAIAITRTTIDAESGIATLALDVSRAAQPGLATVVLANGAQRLAAPIEVLPLQVPFVSSAPSSLAAGRSGQLVVAYGQGTTWLPDVTVAAVPLARGLSVDGLTIVDETTAILEVTVSSEAEPGATGIVLATHGEVSAVPLTIAEPLDRPVLTLDPPALPPAPPEDPERTELVTANVVGGTLSEPINVEIPSSADLELVGWEQVDERTLTLEVRVSETASAGTHPVQVEAPGLVARAGLAVRGPGEPAVWIDPLRIRRGTRTPLNVRVDGMDLLSGPVVATADPPVVLLGQVTVGDTADRATVDATVPAGETIDSFWLTISAGALQVRQQILVGPAIPVVSATGSTVEAGTRAIEIEVEGDNTSFAPQETLVLPGAGAFGLLLGPADVSSPGQISVPVDTSAGIDVDLAGVFVVTGSELVAANLGVRRSVPARFGLPGEVRGSVLPDRGTILEYDGPTRGLQRLSVEPDLEDAAMSLAVFGPDGFVPLSSAVLSTSAIVLPLPPGAFVRVASAEDPGGVDALDFSFNAVPLVADAISELEPNDNLGQAELFPDPVTSPTVMTCSLDPTADRDVFVVTASSPVVFETFAQRILTASSAPDMAMRAPVDGDLVAPALDADLVAFLDVRDLQTVSLGLEGLAGSTGSYLVVARSAVVVNELGWTAGGGYVELRAAPGMPLDGFSILVLNSSRRPMTAEIDLDGAVADDQGILLVSSNVLADVVAADLDLPDNGVVQVLWNGAVVDDVAFGVVQGSEGEPLDHEDTTAVARRFGVDRNDNTLDFEPVPESPGE